MLPDEATPYLSADSVKCDNSEERQNYPIEFLHSLVVFATIVSILIVLIVLIVLIILLALVL